MTKNGNTQHGHDHGRESGSIGLAFFLNLGFAIVELIGGAVTNSVAILSDAVHDFGDTLSLALAWYFERVSGRRRTLSYTYGYRRFSLLGAIINSVVLTVGSVYIIFEAVPRLFAPEETDAGGMILLAIVGIIANGFAVLRTRRGRSLNERVISLHLLEDVLSWAAVLVGAVVMRLTGWSIIDPILSLAVAVFVLVNVWKNIKKVLPILLQGTPEGVEQRKIVGILRAINGVESVHDLHVWSLDESYNILTTHIVLDDFPRTMEQLSELKKEVRAVLYSENIRHATIEFEHSGELCEIRH